MPQQRSVIGERTGKAFKRKLYALKPYLASRLGIAHWQLWVVDSTGHHRQKTAGAMAGAAGMDWRCSMLDDDSKVQAVCRLPKVLALVGERFFLSQVDASPLPGVAINCCTAPCRPNGQATSPLPWLFSTIMAPGTARHGSSPVAIVPSQERRHSISMTSHGPYSFQAWPETF